MPTISLSDDIMFTRLRAFVLAVLANEPTIPEVVRGLDNGVPMPAAPFICITPNGNDRLSRPITSYVDPVTTTGTRNFTQPERYTVQMDCYGPNSAQWAAMIRTLFETEYGTDQMQPDVAPLWCDDPNQLALINGEQQFEQRWSFSAHVQYNPVVSVSQQFAAALTVNLKEVDSEFKA